MRRRDCLKAALGGAASVGLLGRRALGEEARQKVSKLHARYQDTPRGIYSCDMCGVFEPPGACKLVEGEISPEGWCEIFQLAD